MVEEKFEVEKEATTDGYTLYLKGELDLSTASQFRAVVEPLAESKAAQLVLNLRDLNYIDSTGLGVVVAVLKTRDQLGSLLKVEEIPPKVKRIFDLTGISQLLVGTK